MCIRDSPYASNGASLNEAVRPYEHDDDQQNSSDHDRIYLYLAIDDLWNEANQERPDDWTKHNVGAANKEGDPQLGRQGHAVVHGTRYPEAVSYTHLTLPT